MIAISLLYFWCKSYVAIIKHKKIIIHSIFQICSFLEIQESAYMDSFPKSGHISMGGRIEALVALAPQNL